MEHIDAMSELRQAVRLQAYAQINPLREYQEVGFQKFETMIISIESDVTKYINRAQIRDNLVRETVVKPTGTYSGKEDDTCRRAPAKSSKVDATSLVRAGPARSISIAAEAGKFIKKEG